MTTPDRHTRVGVIVAALVAEWIAEGRAPSAYAINDGLCHDFADEVERRCAAFGVAVQSLEICSLMTVDPDCPFHTPVALDRTLIRAHWPGLPQDDATLDAWDAILHDHGVDWSFHSFIHAGGRFYDAEAPQGVATPFDLPIFLKFTAASALTSACRANLWCKA